MASVSRAQSVGNLFFRGIDKSDDKIQQLSNKFNSIINEGDGIDHKKNEIKYKILIVITFLTTKYGGDKNGDIDADNELEQINSFLLGINSSDKDNKQLTAEELRTLINMCTHRCHFAEIYQEKLTNSAINLLGNLGITDECTEVIERFRDMRSLIGAGCNFSTIGRRFTVISKIYWFRDKSEDKDSFNKNIIFLVQALAAKKMNASSGDTQNNIDNLLEDDCQIIAEFLGCPYAENNDTNYGSITHDEILALSDFCTVESNGISGNDTMVRLCPSTHKLLRDLKAPIVFDQSGSRVSSAIRKKLINMQEYFRGGGTLANLLFVGNIEQIKLIESKVSEFIIRSTHSSGNSSRPTWDTTLKSWCPKPFSTKMTANKPVISIIPDNSSSAWVVIGNINDINGSNEISSSLTKYVCNELRKKDTLDNETKGDNDTEFKIEEILSSVVILEAGDLLTMHDTEDGNSKASNALSNIFDPNSNSELSSVSSNKDFKDTIGGDETKSQNNEDFEEVNEGGKTKFPEKGGGFVVVQISDEGNSDKTNPGRRTTSFVAITRSSVLNTYWEIIDFEQQKQQEQQENIKKLNELVLDIVNKEFDPWVLVAQQN